ncbi:Nn.00g060150.m01.CDS01 [Neocucurbitaria sp. VM-36]
MTDTLRMKKQYDDMAAEYNAYEDLPVARLEAELIRTALGDCTGKAVLDIGGDSGTYARQAIKAGARQIDVVDISDSKMQIGPSLWQIKRLKSLLGTKELRGMWENIARSLKFGGKFIGARAIAPGCYAEHNVKTGKYGCL